MTRLLETRTSFQQLAADPNDPVGPLAALAVIQRPRLAFSWVDEVRFPFRQLFLRT